MYIYIYTCIHVYLSLYDLSLSLYIYIYIYIYTHNDLAKLFLTCSSGVPGEVAWASQAGRGELEQGCGISLEEVWNSRCSLSATVNLNAAGSPKHRRANDVVPTRTPPLGILIRRSVRCHVARICDRVVSVPVNTYAYICIYTYTHNCMTYDYIVFIVYIYIYIHERSWQRFGCRPSLRRVTPRLADLVSCIG